MLMNNVVKASRISETVEANMCDLIGKLCEGEAIEVRNLVWDMVAVRIAMLSGHGDCFALPSLEEC